MALKYKTITRQYYISGGFLGYHLVKSILWRYGYFARFFYRTRFMTIPVLLYGTYWNIKKTLRLYNEAGVLEYSKKRIKFDKES